ncbi:MAG: cupredoxin domain-containing protein, partial [Planctomycetota bacterium]
MNLSLLPRLIGALALLSPTLAAQTTHEVSLFGTKFLPEDITIQVGDTVRWTWVSGFHDVVSGLDGVPNGYFASVLTLAPFVYEVTFDQAFLDAFPEPGNVYDYYCTTHLPGMTAIVRVETGPIGSLDVYGDNPFGSLFAGGSPTLGGSVDLTLFNPVEAPAGPGFGAVLFATAPDPNFPTGTPIPTFGLAQGSAGSLLISS